MNRTIFEQYGTVDRVNLVTDRDTGRSRGFAFVEMSDSHQADQAIAGLNGANFEGRALNVNEARPKPVDPDAPLEQILALVTGCRPHDVGGASVDFFGAKRFEAIIGGSNRAIGALPPARGSLFRIAK